MISQLEPQDIVDEKGDHGPRPTVINRDHRDHLDRSGGEDAALCTNDPSGFTTRVTEYEPSREAFAPMLRWGLELTGLSHRELATALQTNSGTVGRWMRGATAPGHARQRQVLAHLANVYTAYIKISPCEPFSIHPYLPPYPQPKNGS